MNSIIVKENKRIPFIIKREVKEKIIVFKIRDESKITAKRLIKKLLKDKIVSIAFDKGISKEFRCHFRGKINVIEKEDVLFSNLDKIILKLSGMLGIAEGKLTLGVIPGDNLKVIMKKMKEIRGRLRALYVFTKNPSFNTEVADDFYMKTGIPVILKSDMENMQCDILVYLNEKSSDNLNQKGQLIDIFERINDRGIKDVRIKFPEKHKKYNISDCVLARILNEPFKIDSFITKKA